MPKNRKNSGGRVIRIQFKSYLTNALSSGVAVIALHPANMGSGSLTSIYPGFELYRFKKLKVSLVPRGASNNLASCYQPDAVVGSPASTADVLAQLDSALIISPSGHVANQSYVVDPVRLQGQIDWYKCTVDASDGAFENQGSLIFFGTTTEGINTILHGVIEFKNPTDATVAMNALKERLRAEIVNEFQQQARLASPGGTGKRQLLA